MGLTALIRKLDKLLDWVAVGKMDVLNQLGRQFLPEGYWGQAARMCNGSLEELKPTVYLTFDDGPYLETTPALLELLASLDAKATFFLTGSQVARYPDLARAILTYGHAIGNHSYNHLFMPLLPLQTLRSEIESTNKVIKEVTGYCPEMFRPPYGLLDERAALCLSELQMSIVYWGSAPEDWQTLGAERVVRRVLTRLFPGVLIVLHESKLLSQQTLAATKEILISCRKLGYQLAKVEKVA